MKRTPLFISILFTLLLADNRSYVWTYEYMTMEPGMAEVEYYTTFTAPDKTNLNGYVTSEHNFEVEIGMTDRFDFSVYQNFKQVPDQSLEYSGYKLRSRYRLSEKGRLIVDPLLYFEYKGKPDFSKHTLESKIILARDFGSLNIAVNPVLEFEYEDDEWKSIVKMNAGASYRLGSLLKAGFEIRKSESGTYAGPTISHGSERFWAALGSSYNLEGSDFALRMIMGLGL